MSLRRSLWRLLRAVLFRFDAERAHRITVSLIRWSYRFGGGHLLRIASGAPAVSSQSVAPSGECEVFGMRFASRVGLAAGFDKDAEIVPALPSLGFGFAEIGTVTPRPQSGNDRPRLFRDLERQCVFNRMGFNGLGAAVVAKRLESVRDRLPSAFRVGVNVGKNKDTPLEEAARDYAAAAAAFKSLADYIVINVSSPNTAGLRSLQAIESLHPIVDAVKEAIRGAKSPPLLLKLAPEVESEELARIFAAADRWGVDGWVLTNTLAGNREGLSGGWSGKVLTELSRTRLEQARAVTRLPIISVGGIMDADEAERRVRLGANLVQIYSGWIFGGPSFPVEISNRILIKNTEIKG